MILNVEPLNRPQREALVGFIVIQRLRNPYFIASLEGSVAPVVASDDPLTSLLASDCDAWLETNTPGPLLGPLFDGARTHLAPSHPSFRAAELTAHIALRAIRKCADQT